MVEKLIKSIPNKLDDRTNLDEGLRMAFNAHAEYDTFQKKKKYRTDARNVVIIFTDGRTYNETRLESLSKVMYG